MHMNFAGWGAWPKLTSPKYSSAWGKQMVNGTQAANQLDKTSSHSRKTRKLDNFWAGEELRIRPKYSAAVAFPCWENKNEEKKNKYNMMMRLCFPHYRLILSFFWSQVKTKKLKAQKLFKPVDFNSGISFRDRRMKTKLKTNNFIDKLSALLKNRRTY